MQAKTVIISVLIFFCFLGCQKRQVRRSAEIAALSTLTAPLATGYYSYVGSAEAYQTSALALKLPAGLYIREVNRDELDQVLWQLYFNCKNFQTPLLYMGSKGGFHYLSLSTGFGPRQFFRIRKAEYKICNQFPLTVNFSKWRVLSKHGYAINVDEKQNSPFHPTIQFDRPYTYLEDLEIENYQLLRQNLEKISLNEYLEQDMQQRIEFQLSEKELQTIITREFNSDTVISKENNPYPYDINFNPFQNDEFEPDVMNYFEMNTQAH